MIQCVVYVGNMGPEEVSCCQGKRNGGKVEGSSPESEVDGGGNGTSLSMGCITPIMR